MSDSELEQYSAQLDFRQIAQEAVKSDERQEFSSSYFESEISSGESETNTLLAQSPNSLPLELQEN